MASSQIVAPMGVRIAEDLKAKLRAIAIANRRSMNSEIIIILERSVSQTELENKNGTEAAT